MIKHIDMSTRSNKDIFVRGFAKALEEKWQVDVQLKARDSDEGVSILAHKLVLASRSEVLKKILELDEFKAPSQPVEAARPSLQKGRRGMGVGPILNFKKKMITGRPKKQIRKNPETFCCRGHYVMLKRSCETVTFSELKHEELEAFVKFIYSDGSKLSAKAKEHVRSLYVTADKYEIPHLRDLCRNELVKSLTLSNALEVLELSLIPLDKKNILDFIYRFCCMHSYDFLHFAPQMVGTALSTMLHLNLKTIANSLEFKLFATRNTDLTVEIIRAYMAHGFAHILEEQWQVDVLLKAGDSDPDAAISAHKLVLAARSKVFKKMLEEDECKTSSEKEIITLSEMKHEELKALVEFIYSDGSTPCAGHARSLYLAADKYEIPHLRDLTRNELISSLNASNALDVYELAQIPFDDALNNAALSCIRMNIATIAYSDELKLFAESNPNLTVEIMKACVEQNGFAHILEEQWQVDVLLKAGDSDPDAAISAHKLVLAARSKVFKKMLEEDECKTSSGKEIITLSEMKHEESNALDVYELAQIPFDDELNNAALSCIQMNITTIAYSDELKLFAKSNPNLTVEIVKACVERSRNNQYWVEYKNNQYWHKLRLV
ncbi:hypothetical protein HID58_015847 [Brassica napus]|uniref:BTB domain-containing protein n=1 Tax=Brassica napus TaxID=3708 RepID=A0ABQ8DL73_BRANA|nr:hypothetical protein HID58_015847 [Brassica napus]